MTTVAQLEAQVSELNNRVEALTREAASAREAARAVITPMDPYAASAAAAKSEKERHKAWKRSRGYGAKPAAELQLETDEQYQRAVTAAAKAEAAQKEQWQALNRANAEHRAKAATGPEPDALQRQAAGVAHQRAVEAGRLRVGRIVEEALAPAGDIR